MNNRRENVELFQSLFGKSKICIFCLVTRMGIKIWSAGNLTHAPDCVDCCVKYICKSRGMVFKEAFHFDSE